MKLPVRITNFSVDSRSDGNMNVFIQYMDEAMEPGSAPNSVVRTALARWIEKTLNGVLSEQTQTDSI